MSTAYETGHAKNVANFENLLTFISAYGATYNPSNPAIQLVALNTKAQEARTTAEQVNTHLANYNIATATRAKAFEPMQKLSTRLFNALKATDASKQEIATLKQTTENYKDAEHRQS
ncbi:hypothetical protein [Pedobacter paludis]|uniref:Uncharacterized protein n=1 Tax=Pedobacter paludis TaxID=2203212 RepID=A0A317F8I0_9SPHI|nr:hypothetical protein [Pedobacter paludis]PWS33868.1 hypothetical protein DF947_04465 [Pedobacter paludis]